MAYSKYFSLLYTQKKPKGNILVFLEGQINKLSQKIRNNTKTTIIYYLVGCMNFQRV